MRASRLFVVMEVGAFHYAMLLMARLPSRLAYTFGRMAGDFQYQVESSNRKMILECLELALGEQFSPEGRIRVARDYFRLGACKDLDWLRLTGNGQGLAKLVKVRGLEHIKDALAQGKGAVIASSHFGSYRGALGVLGVLGFPVRSIAFRGRQRRLSFAQILVRPFELAKTLRGRILKLHLQQPIYVDEGRRGMVAVEAAKVLERNELLWVMLDVVDFPSRHPKAVPIPFLNGLAYVPTGAVRIAKSTGAPLLICLMHRSPDWRHQIMEISAPIPTEGSIDEVNRRCVMIVEDAIRSEPAHWRSWNYPTMASIGLIPEREMKRFVQVGGTWVQELATNRTSIL